MLLPVRTDYRLTRPPVVNYLIIALNIIIYFLGYNASTEAGNIAIEPYMLDPHAPQLVQFFTSVFLHGNFMHLFGNMLFLLVFGNAINDKLGNLGYLVFYLAGGILACVGYLLLGGNAPVLGASGAIAAVCGAFLVLLPRTRVTLILFMIIITPIYVPSLYAIAFQFIFDMLMTLNGLGGSADAGVAYAAHSSGYLFGMIVALFMLWAGLIKRDNFDFLHMIQQYRRREQLRQAINDGYDPFGKTPPKTVRMSVVSADAPPSLEGKLRSQISSAIEARDYPAAAGLYIKLLEENPNAALSCQNQLDVANQLMAGQSYAAAAHAYEIFIKHYGNYQYIGDIYLMLGMVYSRYLKKAGAARPLLEKAVELLHDDAKIAVAKDSLRALDE